MLVTIPFTSLVALVSCASILGAPASDQDSSRYTISRRQPAPANQNAAKNLTARAENSVKMTQMTELQKENVEAAEEKRPGLNTIANAINELYFHDKYGGQKNDPTLLLKMAGKAAGGACKSGDPEAVSKAMLGTFESYNQGKPSSISASPIAPLNKNTMSMEETPSLKTVSHSLHEAWEKIILLSPKPDNAQVIPAFCQAIASSSAGGDPVAVSKSIDGAYAKMSASQ